MPNVGVRGRVVDDADAPRPGLRVRAFDIDALAFRDELGEATTKADGRFRLSYSADRYGPTEKRPDIVLAIYLGAGLLHVTKEVSDVAAEVLDVGTIRLRGRNIGVRGRVIDDLGAPHRNLVVIAQDVDDLNKDDALGRDATNADGRWEIIYSPSTYEGAFKERPDIFVKVMDVIGARELLRTAMHSDVSASMLDLGDLVVPRAVADGWAATLGRTAASRLSVGNRITPLIDNQTAFREIISALRNSKRSISLMQLAIEPDMIATYNNDGPYHSNATTPRDRILQTVLDANARGIVTRILLNENAIIPDTIDEVRQWFSDNQPNTVAVRSFPLSYETMHAKALVVDGEVGGSLFAAFVAAGAGLLRDRGLHQLAVQQRHALAQQIGVLGLQRLAQRFAQGDHARVGHRGGLLSMFPLARVDRRPRWPALRLSARGPRISTNYRDSTLCGRDPSRTFGLNV